MVNEILKRGPLENLLQKNWADFLDCARLLRLVMEHVRDNPFKEIKQHQVVTSKTQLQITKITVARHNAGAPLEAWAEFTIPKNNGVVIGTAILGLKLSGEVDVIQSFGTCFLPEIK